MKKIIFIVILFSGLVLSQQLKVVYNEVYQTETAIGNKDDILKISSYGYIIKSEGDDFSLIDKDKNFERLHIYNRKGKTQKERQRESMRFSPNDRYLCINELEDNRTVLKIYDTINKNYRVIKHQKGNIVTASVYSMEKILYQVREKMSPPKVYMLESDQEPIFITEGLGEMWSPNGKWFLVEECVGTADRFGRKPISKFAIFNSDREKVFETAEFGIVGPIRWSPNSDKLIIGNHAGTSFYIVYLEEIGGKLIIKNKYHFTGFENEPEKKRYYGVMNPECSPDGSKISFKRTSSDGHISFGDNIWILEDTSYNCYAISDFKDTDISDITWSQSGEIFAIKEIRDLESNNKEIIKISIGE